jgi:GNAT superfamily N-acetyltransferase
MEFQLYQQSDHQDLSEMIFALYDEDLEGEPMTREKISRTVNESRRHPEKVNIYMFKNGGETIGYAILVHFWSNEYGGDILDIDELYVREKHRNQGAAGEFMRFAGEFQGIVALQLETTPSNEKALAFYKKIGFLPDRNTHLTKII